MKKILISIILINIFTLNSFSAELKNCSKYSKLSTKYYKCKTGNFIEDTKNYQKKEWSKEKSKLEDVKNKALNK